MNQSGSINPLFILKFLKTKPKIMMNTITTNIKNIIRYTKRKIDSPARRDGEVATVSFNITRE